MMRTEMIKAQNKSLRAHATQSSPAKHWIAASGLALLAMTVLFLSPAFAQSESVLDIKEVTSQGGIKAWLVEDHSVAVISVNFSFRGAGAANDPANKQGLARLVSNTMDEGAGNLNAQAFQKALRDQVISLSFSSGRDHFSGSLKTLSKNKERAFELTEMAVNDPRFDNEALERMRNSNLARIKSALANPDWMAARILNDKAFEDHPYAMNSGGTLSSLKNIKTGDLEDFHEEYIGKNNLVVAVAGDITAEELGPVLDQIFGDLPEVETDAPDSFDVKNQGQVFVYERDIPQTVVEIMKPGIARTDPDYHTAQVMNFILGSSGFGSRLTKEIREKEGLTYGIYSYFYNLDSVNALAISTSTTNENVPKMLEAIRAEFNKMAGQIEGGVVTDKELADAKAYLIGSLPLSLTSTDKISGMLLSLQLDDLPIDYLDQREKTIQNASTKDVQTLASKLLSPESFVTILVGQPGEIEGASAVKTLPNVE